MIFHELRFAIYAIKKNIQSSAELRTSFLLNIVGMAINNTALIVLWVLFARTVGVIGGWRAVDIVGMQGFVALSFGLVFSACTGLERLPDIVASGAFDRFMLSPKNLLLRVATSSFSVSGLGDILFGLICITFYGIVIHVDVYQVIGMVIVALLSTIVFLAMTIAVFSTGFFVVDAGTFSHSLFELFLTPSLFHGGAFHGAMRLFFTFIIPSLLIGSLPVEAIRDVSFTKLILVAVLAFVWLILSIRIFYSAVRRYESSSFMTFGN